MSESTGQSQQFTGHIRGGSLSRLKTLSLIGLLLGLILKSAPTYAQTAPQTSYTYTFGQTAIFNLTLPSSYSEAASATRAADALQASLYLRIKDNDALYTRTYTTTVKEGQATYQRDLREAPFPPFGQITFWWTYTDPPSNQQGKSAQEGSVYETEKTTFIYEDNRFQWHELRTDDVISPSQPNNPIIVHWVAGEVSLMHSALDIAQTSIQEIQSALQISLDAPIRLYIYPSLPDLQSALRLAGRNWIGASAHPDVGVVLLAIPPSENARLRMENDIPHEITHIILQRMLGAQSYANLPTWLVEGLASYFEQRPETTYALSLQRAYEENRLIPITQLCGTFPMDAEQAILAYAESQSLVTYLKRHYGWSRLRVLLNAYGDGLSCTEGVKQILEKDLATLDREWRVWLEQTYHPESATNEKWITMLVLLRDIGPWLLITGMIFLPSTVFLISSLGSVK